MSDPASASVQGQAEAGPALFRWHLWAAGQEVQRLRAERDAWRELAEALDACPLYVAGVITAMPEQLDRVFIARGRVAAVRR